MKGVIRVLGGIFGGREGGRGVGISDVCEDWGCGTRETCGGQDGMS